ncbi:hypothetical protein GCM10020221_29870 [Streptomyces thioluteus]|uniref:Uncharacterized protein n=1 Tax=Streptomyces thioluteus TaxID=66431 RepID=A0ABN3X082_STRTU
MPGEAGGHQMVGVVVLGVAGAHLAEVAGGFVLGGAGVREEQQGQPGGGVEGRHAGGGGAQGAGPLGVLPAAGGLLGGGAGQQGGGVGAVGLGELPLAAPGDPGGDLAEDEEAVATAVPVVAGPGQEPAGLGPAAAGQFVADGDQLGVVERGVEGGSAPEPGAAEGAWRGHR